MGKLYDEKSIESLSPLAFTRLRPQVYCGDTTYSTQLLVEIVSNAVDEYRSGHGDKIEVVINKDVISVRDYGQGFIPNSVREDGKTVLEAAFSVLNTSGKYREDGAYEGTSLGSFGIGSKLANYLSHYLDVVTYRDGSGEYIHFEEGVFSLRKKLPQGKNLTGTKVIWQPSEEFFTNVEVEIDKVKTLFKTISCLCQGLTIDLDYNGEKIIYYSKNGLSDLLDEAVEGKEILKNRFLMNYANGKNKLDIIFTYTKNYSSTIVPYVNIGLTEKGPHITQIKTIITREFNKFFREKKWLKEKEDNLTGDDIQEGLYVVFNITAPTATCPEYGSPLASADIILAKRSISAVLYPPDTPEEAIPNADSVFGPTIPSGFSPLLFWNAITALLVLLPKIPSTEPVYNPKSFSFV